MGAGSRAGSSSRAGAVSRTGDTAAPATGDTGRTGVRAPESALAESADASLALRRSARRITAALHTFQPLLDPAWSERIRGELAWLSGTLAQEQACAARLTRLVAAMNRLSGSVPSQRQGEPVSPGVQGAGSRPAPAPGNLTVGAAKAAALLERQLAPARSRAHSSALRALGSARFHAVADAVTLLAGEVPLIPAATTADLRPLAAAAEDRLVSAVAALPLTTAGRAYNAEALVHGLSPDLAAPHPQDTPWHQVRLLLRLHRYAREVLFPGQDDARLPAAARALNTHRDAAEAASAVAQAARTPRISPATAYALGVLHAEQRYEVEAARFAFQRCWHPGTENAKEAMRP